MRIIPTRATSRLVSRCWPRTRRIQPLPHFLETAAIKGIEDSFHHQVTRQTGFTIVERYELIRIARPFELEFPF